MYCLSNTINLFHQEQEAKKAIQDIICLLLDKQILDTEAEQILNTYKGYINNNYVSLYSYAVFIYAATYCNNRN